jgi:RNA polymerase sigma factor (sigma-70 family)
MPRRLLLRLLASAPAASDHVPDAELLRRFVTSNDSAALELVVRRHADGVWTTCRQMLKCDADAEDAFQATFLALIRKAKSIRTPCAGGWLHRVAVNSALKLRERAARTSATDPQHLDAIPTPAAAQPDLEHTAIVHEELARLSERERLPLLLCDLEGLSHADAAKALGWPVGTLSGRLSRARAKLRERLARRGVTPAPALLPALAIPPHLIPNALSLIATAPPAVALLTEGVLSAMRTAKLKFAALVLTATGFVALAGLGTVFALAPKAAPPAPEPARQGPAHDPRGGRIGHRVPGLRREGRSRPRR